MSSFICLCAKRGCQDVWLLHQLHQAQTNSCSKPDFSGSRAQKRTKSPATLGVTLFLVAWLKASSTHGKTSGSWTWAVDYSGSKKMLQKVHWRILSKVQVQWQGDGMSMLFFVTITGFNCFIPLVGAWWRYSIQDFLQKSSALDWENKKVRQLCTEAWLPQSN